jgi:putative transposon-encoded protein
MRLMKVAPKKDIAEDQNAVESTPQAVPSDRMVQNKVKFEVLGEEMLEKEVKLSGNSGRVYLPPDWVGHRVKIIRMD